MRTFILIGYSSPYVGWDYGMFVGDVMRKFVRHEVFSIGRFSPATWYPGRLKGANR